ncbi:MAG: phosphohistidine phosphatase SixA [Nostocaceae cyanobacterium]|nr:phosphohistidine phosphatase SixA [Nostocaceae cyanobacterium]
MELYLIRHGIAVDRSEEIPENERMLTPEGRQKMQKVAKRLDDLGVSFSLMVTSPLVRARQTAEILLAQKLSSQLEESHHLAPSGDILDWLTNWLEPRQFTNDTKIAIVGHEPNLSNWADMLVWGFVKGGIVLRKAGIIGLTLPETGSKIGHSQIFWLTSPKFFLKN